MNLELTDAQRLAKAKQKRLDDRLTFLALHGDYILCPILLGGLGLFCKVLL
jgi:hypothetical protein